MHSLYLFPADASQTAPPPNEVRECLTNLDLLGDALGQSAFLVGDSFFRHFSFAGCSPSMQLTPPDDGTRQFVHIQLLGMFASSQLFVSKQYSKPRCPACRKRLKTWQQILHNEQACPCCGHRLSNTQLEWRNYAAWGKLLVEIRDVFPGEVLPSEELLDALSRINDQQWQYGWAESY